MAFTKALAAAELPAGGGTCVVLAGKKIALFHIAGRFVAIDDACSHDEASLAEGHAFEEDGRCLVECPWHGARFDLLTGAAVTRPAVKPVKTYATRVENGNVEVDV